MGEQLIITMHILSVHTFIIFFCSQHPEITKDFLKLRNQLEREVCNVIPACSLPHH